MAKYIDAEKLVAEIERLIAEYDKWIEEQRVRREELASLKEDFLDTISEEPDKSLKEVAEKYADETYYAYPPEFLDFVKEEIMNALIVGAKWQEGQFEKNRLAACEKQTKEEYDREMEFAASIIEKEHRQPTFSDAINYGIEWQKKQIPLPEDTVLFQKGVEEGKRLMLEDAVECSVYAGKEGDKWIVSYIGNYESMLKTCKGGNTVRIIVLPKEDEK